MLNCDLMFASARELGISEEEQKRIDRMLHPEGEPLFLTQSLEKLCWFNDKALDVDSEEVEFKGSEVVFPANLVADGTRIEVNVKGPKDSKGNVLSDWSIEKVERDKKNDFSSFEATYISEEAKNYDWKPGVRVTVNVYPNGDEEVVSKFFFDVEEARSGAVDFFLPFKGYKNHWYEYAKPWENSVKFVRVG